MLINNNYFGNGTKSETPSAKIGQTVSQFADFFCGYRYKTMD